MTEDTVQLTSELLESEKKGVRIEYYTLDGKTPEIYMCPGDLMLICNVLHDYSALLGEYVEDGQEQQSYQAYYYQYHIQRIKKIQNMIEASLGYSTEAAIEKCKKKRQRQKKSGNVDVGEDALVLAVRRRGKSSDSSNTGDIQKEIENKEKIQKKNNMSKNKNEIPGQITLFV